MMSARRWYSLLAVAASLGLSGCMLCDRYCDRQHDRCQQYRNPACYPPAGNQYPAPATGSYYPQPAQQYPAPVNCP